MQDTIDHLREMMQDLKAELGEARQVARNLHRAGTLAVEAIDDGSALEGRGDLSAALEDAEVEIESWPEES